MNMFQNQYSRNETIAKFQVQVVKQVSFHPGDNFPNIESHTKLLPDSRETVFKIGKFEFPVKYQKD